MAKITENFDSKSDVMIFNTAANGEPSKDIVENMTKVLTELQKARTYFAIVFLITSGWRASWRNAKLKDASKTSSHITGFAVDFQVKGNLFAVFAWIVEHLEYDQVIYETDAKGSNWIHFGLRKGPLRRQSLIGTYNKKTSKIGYEIYKPQGGK